MSDLPDSVRQAGTMFQNPLALTDHAYRRKIIDWGFQQIDEEYPLDAVRAPLNVFRRKRAQMEWEGVIRTNGRELRAVVAGHAIDQLRFELDRYRQNVLAADAEARRRDGAAYDFDARQREQELNATRTQRLQIEIMRLQHELNQDAEAAASRRRQSERAHETEQAIAARIADAVIQSMGSTSAEETIKATRLVNEEIAKIRRDSNLTPDEQHLHIKTLLDTLPTMLRNLRPRDV